MRLARLTPLASIGLLLLATAGCYRPYSTPYGSPYGYPSAPVQTLTPGNPYTPTAPGGSYPGGSYPGGTYGSPTPIDNYHLPTPSGNSTYSPGGTFQQGGTPGTSPFFGGSSSAPPYNGGAVPSGGGGVPSPFDPGEVQFQNSRPAPVAEDFNLNEHGSLQGIGATTENVAKVAIENTEFFEPVRSVTQEPQPTLAVNQVALSGPQPPYAHDADGFRWLRGVARRNESTGVWSIIYNTVDAAADPYQGWLTLGSDPLMDQLQPNGVYLVSGQLDRSRTDPAGKPVYHVQSIKPWEPTSTL